MVSLGVAGYASSVSADGKTIAGVFANAGHNEAFVWTAGTGAVGLGVAGYTHSYSTGISPDGGTVVGFAAGAGTTQAFRWTAGGGMEMLGWFPAGTPQSAAWDVSDTGVVVGVAGHIGSNEAFYWTPALGALTGLGYLAGGSGSAAYAITADGNFIAGESGAADGLGHAVRWAQSGGSYVIADLGMLAGWTGAMGLSLSGGGMQALGDWLATTGVNVGAWSLYEARGISADGSTIVGYGRNPAGDDEAFLARAGAFAGVTDFSDSVASLRQAARLPGELGRAAIVMDMPGIRGIAGWSAAPVYRHVSGSRGDLGGAALTWREPGFAVSGTLGVIDAATSGLHDGGQGDYRGWWLGAAAALDVADLLGRPAVKGLEIGIGLRSGQYDATIKRNYFNGAAIETARGKPDAEEFTALVRLDWRHPVNDKLHVIPHLQWLYSRSEMDAYTETGGALAGSVSTQKHGSAESSAGMSLAWQAAPDLELQARYSINHLYDDSGAPVTVSVPGIGSFIAGGMAYDANWHAFGVGIDRVINKHTRLNASLATTSGSDYPDNWSAGIALHFGL
jgi:hypothetical protein